MEVWGRQSSVNVQKVMWAAAELGLAVRRYDAGGAYGVVGTDDYAALNSNRLVPVLRDGDLVLWESNTIVRYLASKAGDETLWPSDIAERALLDRWFDWASCTLGPQFGPLFIGLVRTRAADRNPAVLERARGQSQLRFEMLDRHLAGRRFIAGDAFTMGDIAPGAMAYRWFGLAIERPRLANLEGWYNRLTERQAYRLNVMIPII